MRVIGGGLIGVGCVGHVWSSVPSPYKGSLFGAVLAADGAVVAYGLRGRIYRSTDKARMWKQVDNASTPSIMGGVRLPEVGQ